MEVSATPGTLVAAAVNPDDFSDADGDPLTFTLSLSRDDVHVEFDWIGSGLFYQARRDCALANISPAVNSGDTISATVTAIDPDGASVSVTAGYVISSTACPSFTSAAVDGTTLNITLSANAHGASTPPGADKFEVKVAGTAVALADSSPVAMSGKMITLTLAAAVTVGQTVTVSYTPDADALAGESVADGPKSVAFADRAVTNNTAALAISSVAIVSKPRLDANSNGTKDTYGAGQKIAVDVTWAEVVAWDVSATNAGMAVQLQIGSNTRSAELVRGGATSGSAATLRFAYAVVAADSDTDGVAVAANAQGRLVLLRNGATLKNADGTANASVTHAGLGAQSGHKVPGGTDDPGNSAPTFSGTASGTNNAPPTTLVHFEASTSAAACAGTIRRSDSRPRSREGACSRTRRRDCATGASPARSPGTRRRRRRRTEGRRCR